MIDRFHLSAELLDILGELTVFAGVINQATNVLLVTLGTEGDVSSIFVFPRLTFSILKDLGAAVCARLRPDSTGANSFWSGSEVKLAFIFTIDDACEADGVSLVRDTHESFFFVSESAMKVLL